MVRFHSEPFLEILNLCALPGLQKLIYEGNKIAGFLF